jgi:hypothetical protein
MDRRKGLLRVQEDIRGKQGCQECDGGVPADWFLQNDTECDPGPPPVTREIYKRSAQPGVQKSPKISAFTVLDLFLMPGFTLRAVYKNDTFLGCGAVLVLLYRAFLTILSIKAGVHHIQAKTDVFSWTFQAILQYYGTCMFLLAISPYAFDKSLAYPTDRKHGFTGHLGNILGFVRLGLLGFCIPLSLPVAVLLYLLFCGSDFSIRIPVFVPRRSQSFRDAQFFLTGYDCSCFYVPLAAVLYMEEVYRKFFRTLFVSFFNSLWSYSRHVRPSPTENPAKKVRRRPSDTPRSS